MLIGNPDWWGKRRGRKNGSNIRKRGERKREMEEKEKRWR